MRSAVVATRTTKRGRAGDGDDEPDESCVHGWSLPIRWDRASTADAGSPGDATKVASLPGQEAGQHRKVRRGQSGAKPGWRDSCHA